MPMHAVSLNLSPRTRPTSFKDFWTWSWTLTGYPIRTRTPSRLNPAYPQPLSSFSRTSLDYDRDPLSDADAHRRQSVLARPGRKLVHQRQDHAGAGRTKWVTPRDRTTVHVHFFRIETDLADARNRLRRKSFVEL